MEQRVLNVESGAVGKFQYLEPKLCYRKEGSAGTKQQCKDDGGLLQCLHVCFLAGSYLLEVALSEVVKIQYHQCGYHYECRYSDGELCDQLLEEYVQIAHFLKPEEIRNEVHQ